jgi:hypothetical protein
VDPAEKDRPIDPMSGKNTSAEKSPIRGQAFESADGRQPFMPLECLTTPAFDTYPFGFAMRGGCGRFPSGALRAPFIQRWIIISEIPTSCKENAPKVSNKTRRRPFRLG